MKPILKFLITGLLAATSYGQTATYSVKTISNNCFAEAGVVGTGAQQNAIVHYGKYVFMAFYNKSSRKLSLARSNNNGIDGWKIITFDDVYNSKRNGKWNKHNTPNVQISPIDKSVHLAFDMHGEPLKYKLSVKGAATVPNNEWRKKLFGKTRNYLKKNQKINKVTYPRMIIGKDNTLLFFYRDGGSGNGNSFVHRYNSKNQSWSGPIKVIDGKKGTFRSGSFKDKDRNAYFNDFQMRDGRLYASWCWRETYGLTNHDMMFAYSDNNGITWKSDSGQTVGTSGPRSVKMNLNTKEIKVQSIGINAGLINQGGMAVDGSGNVHIAYLQDGEYYHLYNKSNSPTTWKRQKITNKNHGRPKLYADRNTNTLYMVRQSDNAIELYATLSNGNRWNKWKLISKVKDAKYINETNSYIDGDSIKTLGVTDNGKLQLITFNFNSNKTPELIDKKTSLSVFPNPSNNGIYQLNKIVDWKIIDLQGKQILRGNETRLDLSGYASGTYFLKSGEKTVKLINK